MPVGFTWNWFVHGNLNRIKLLNCFGLGKGSDTIWTLSSLRIVEIIVGWLELYLDHSGSPGWPWYDCIGGGIRQHITGIQITSPILTLYHVIPRSASFYWPSTTKYQTVSPYTDPVPAGTTYNSSFRKAQLNNFSFYDSFDESRTVYLV